MRQVNTNFADCELARRFAGSALIDAPYVTAALRPEVAVAIV